MNIYNLDNNTDDEDYENPFLYIDPGSLNSYFKPQTISSESSNFPKFTKINSDEYLNKLDSSQYPNLVEIFYSQPEFSYLEFYNVATYHFIKFNELELNFISKNFSPKKYEDSILKNVLAQEHTINRSQFNTLLQKEFIQDFNDLYLKGLLAKYALDNFSTLTLQDQNQLWHKLQLYIPQKSFIKDYFFDKALQYNVKITDPLFFKNTDSKNITALTDYVIMAIKNQWSDNIVHFSKRFPNICFKYLGNNKNFKTEENINFERLFLYYNPAKIQHSHLSESDINLVFSKLYQNLQNKDLLSESNANFLKSLDLGLYKFLEVAYQNDPDNVDKFLFAKHESGFENLQMLVDNIEKINEKLKQSFEENLLCHYLPKLLTNNSLQSGIIYNLTDNCFLFNALIKKSYISVEEKTPLIHVLFENYLSNPERNKNDFFNKLNSFPLECLKNFENYLNYSMTIFKINYHETEDILIEAQQIFNKILLNHKLNDKLENEIESITGKRLKI